MTAGEILTAMTEIYRQQNSCYLHILNIVREEQAAIEQDDSLSLLLLIKMESRYLERIKLLADEQKNLRELLQSHLLGRHFYLDELVCKAAPAVLNQYKEVLCENTLLLEQIDKIKSENIKHLQWLMKPVFSYAEAVNQ